METQVPTVPLNSGHHMPIVGLGTWQADNETSIQTTLQAALDAGYRHIDTAFSYRNERYIGNALASVLKEGKLKREELFIVTKLPFNGMHPDSVESFFKKSLDALQLEYVDLYLIHCPIPTKSTENDHGILFTEGGNVVVETIDLVETWRVMESLVDKGLVKSIGLSNFNSKQIQRIYDAARIKPSNLQVECHAYLPQYELFEFCQKLGISMTAYSPIGSPTLSEYMKKRMGLKFDNMPKLLEDEKVKPIAQKHKKTSSQILLKYLIQRGIIVIPKSQTPERIKENIQVFDFTLDDDDMRILKSMNCGFRYFKFDYWSNWKNHPEYPFNIPF